MGDAFSLGIFSSWGVANLTTVTFSYILVMVFLFPLNIGVSPCFNCTVLVPVYRVYTCCFNNTVVSSCYRLHIKRFPWLYINYFQSLWFCCIIIEFGIFPWWVSMFLKKGEDFKKFKKGRWKKKGVGIHVSALWYIYIYVCQRLTILFMSTSFSP